MESHGRKVSAVIHRTRLEMVSLVALAGLLVCVALLPASAFAAKVGARSDSVVVSPGSAGSHKAKCKKGTSLVGAGYDTATEGSMPTRAITNKLVPRRRSVASQAATTGGGDTVNHELVAYCMKRAKTKIVKQTAVLEPNQIGASIVTCPGKKVVLGGGFQFPPITERAVVPLVSQPYFNPTDDPNKWGVFAYSSDPSPVNFKAYAICVRKPKPLLVVTDEAVGGGGTTAATATCPKGTKILSGGFAGAYGAGPSDGSTSLEALSAFRSAGRSWTVVAYPRSGPNTIYSYGLCA